MYLIIHKIVANNFGSILVLYTVYTSILIFIMDEINSYKYLNSY